MHGATHYHVGEEETVCVQKESEELLWGWVIQWHRHGGPSQLEGCLVLRLAKGNTDLGVCFTGGCGLSFLSLSNLISSLRASLGKFLIVLLLSFASAKLFLHWFLTSKPSFCALSYLCGNGRPNSQLLTLCRRNWASSPKKKHEPVWLLVFQELILEIQVFRNIFDNERASRYC